MISIDNSVELMMKTFLGLPRRVTGLTITRKEFQDVSESFPALLDALEKFAGSKLDGLDLGAIEWYHRLRNQLYHQGNGLTVERDKVEIYAELANLLFTNLFGYRLIESPTSKTELLGEFLVSWADVERALRKLAAKHISEEKAQRLTVLTAMKTLLLRKDLPMRDVVELEQYRRIRNLAAHGEPEWEASLTAEVVERVRTFAKRLERP